MDTYWQTVHYTTLHRWSEDEGYDALELVGSIDGNSKVMARIVYWDAQGQYYLEVSATEVPLHIIEELIRECRLVMPNK